MLGARCGESRSPVLSPGSTGAQARDGARHTCEKEYLFGSFRMYSFFGIFGSIGEIGVHHGVFFLALAGASAEGESLFAIVRFSPVGAP